MTRHEWKSAWRFVREMWAQIDCGDLWGLLDERQAIAASLMWSREK